MKANRKTPPAGPLGADDMEADVYDALRALGWVVPQSEDDVRDAEDELQPAPSDLPDELKNAEAMLRRPRRTAPPPAGPHLPLPSDPDIDSTLARAAREGGHIPPDIEEAMRRDRQAAERDAEDGDQTQET